MSSKPVVYPWCGCVALLVALATGTSAYAQAPGDPVARLQKQLDSGAVKLDHNGRNGYLDSVLRHLAIRPSSQSLVFSKTSFQRDRISPTNPRAIYFDDNTYVGWVRGGDLLELAATDPQFGTIFYTLDQRKAADGTAPTLKRETHACFQCHASAMTRDTPGLLVRSVYPDATGLPVLSAGTYLTTQQSPWSQRWGGWYVTGTYGDMRHMGNSVVTSEAQPDASLDRAAGANVTDLSKKFDPSAYPAPGSDVVALLVLEHQAGTHNVLARSAEQARAALRDEAAMNQALGRTDADRSDGTKARLEAAAEALVRQVLFVDEPKLTDPVEGTSSFAADFEAKGPRDSMGRSLRDLDLKRRLFRYPLSYLIYSESFDALPDELKEHAYRRLWEVLSRNDDTADFAHLKRSQRRAIVQILAETKNGLPPYWKALTD